MAGESSDVMTGVIKAVLTAGLESSLGISIDSAPDVDLTPIVKAMDELRAVDEGVLDALRNPTRTAGDEYLDRAATSFKYGWYDLALKDALASIDAYPIQAKPYFVAAVSSFELGDGEKAMTYFQSAIKFAPNGQQEIGAAAAVYGARLALMAGGPNFALSFLQSGDALTDRRCVEILALESALAPSPDVDGALFRLWRQENATVFDHDWSVGELTAEPALTMDGYEFAGNGFHNLVRGTIGMLDQRRALATALVPQLRSRRDALKVKLDPTATLRQALTAAHYPKLGMLWDGSLGDTIERAGKAKDAAGTPLYAGWPAGGVAWLDNHPPIETARMLRATIWGADTLWGAIADNALVSHELKSQWYRQIMDARAASDPTQVADQLAAIVKALRLVGRGSDSDASSVTIMRLTGVPGGPIGGGMLPAQPS